MPGPSNQEEIDILDARIELATNIGLFNVPLPLTIVAFTVLGNVGTITINNGAVATGMTVDTTVQIAGCDISEYNDHYRVAGYGTSGSFPTQTTQITVTVPPGLGNPSTLGTVGLWTELTGVNYTRPAIVAADWSDASGGAPTTKPGPKSGTVWAFNQAGAGGWALHPYPVVGWGLFKAPTGGTPPFWVGVLPAPTTVNEDDNVEFNETNQVICQMGDRNDPF